MTLRSVLISEISPVHLRRWFVSINQLALTCGVVPAFLVDYALAGAHEWRWMFGLSAIRAVILGVGMCFLPESPRRLLSRQMTDEPCRRDI
jgi:MFS family permease